MVTAYISSHRVQSSDKLKWQITWCHLISYPLHVVF